MSRVVVGDVVIHCADVHVRAGSRVTHSPELAPRPFESDEWGEDGWLIRTAYEELPLLSTAMRYPLKSDGQQFAAASLHPRPHFDNQRPSDRARRSARRRTAAKRSAPARSVQGVSDENGDATARYTLGVGGRRPSTRPHLAATYSIYPHLTSVALTPADQCPTLIRY
jgi:hypothetical protein